MSACDLTTLAQVQTLYTTATNSAQVLTLISAISEQILVDISRGSIVPATYVETFDGDGRWTLLPQNWPVLSVSSLVIDGVSIPAAAVNAPGVPPGSGWVLDPPSIIPPGRMQRLSLRNYQFRRGLQNVTLTYTAGYQVSGEAWNVPTAPSFQIIPKQRLGAWGSDVGVTYASTGLPLTAVAGAPAAGQYSVSAGVYTFSSADAGAAVLISYGFIPQSLALSCAQWVADSIAYSGRVGLKSKSIGGQETISYDVAPIPTRVNRDLQPFRRVAFL